MNRSLALPLSLALMAALPAQNLLAAQARRTARTSKPSHAAAAPDTSSAFRNIFWQPNNLIQGSPAFFTVELDKPATRVTATWAFKTLTFFKTTDPKVWYSLAGDDLETKPGSFGIAVTATLAGGHTAHTTKQMDIAAANFKSGAIDVPENFVEPDAAGQKQIALDTRLKARAFARSAAAPLWSGDFRKPVAAPSTDSFGETRVLNEEKTSEHRGTDFPAPESSPVSASNSGVVVLADNLFYEGNCVIIDHGQKLYTIYMHLSKLDVKAGDKVKKGERLGLSGSTGRVTGPHLHMGVRWNGANLDPVQFLALTLPAIPANESAAARSASARPAAHRTTRRSTRRR